MNRNIFSALAAVLVTSMLMACGGGGGTSPGPTPTPTSVIVTCPNGTNQTAASNDQANALCAAPVVLSISPSSGGAAVSVDVFTSVDVTTDSTLDPSSINTANVTLKFGANVVTGAVSMVGTKGFKFSPTGKLTYGQTYAFSASVRDALGRTLLITSTFTTALAIPQNPMTSGQQLKCADIGGWMGYAYVKGQTEYMIDFVANQTGLNCVALSWVEYVDPTTGRFFAPRSQNPLSDIYTVANYAHLKGLNIALQLYLQVTTTSDHITVTPFYKYFGGYDALFDARKKTLDDFAIAFLPQYKSYLTDLGKIATDTHAVYMTVGGEMIPLDASAFDWFWTDAIAAARTTYKGPLTYIMGAAIEVAQSNAVYALTAGEAVAYKIDSIHWVDMWKYLDLVGPEINPNLVPPGTSIPSYADAMTDWVSNTLVRMAPVNILSAWKTYADSFGKPLIAIETGYSSNDVPWSGPESLPTQSGDMIKNFIYQAELTQAFFDNEKNSNGILASYSFLSFVGTEPFDVLPPDSTPFSTYYWWRYGPTTYRKPVRYTISALTKGTNQLIGDDSDNMIVALVGRPSIINGGAGNDSIHARAVFGSTINGGGGANRVIYYGIQAAEASVINLGNGSFRVSSGANTDILSNIASVEFIAE